MVHLKHLKYFVIHIKITLFVSISMFVCIFSVEVTILMLHLVAEELRKEETKS